MRFGRCSRRLDELERQVTDKNLALPLLDRRIQQAYAELGVTELNRRLDGKFVGVAIDDRGQPMIVVRREVNEVLTEIPDELKLKQLARHFAGDKLSEAAQKALGIDMAIEAAIKALATPKPAPELTAKKPSRLRH